MDLGLALTAFAAFRTPARIGAELRRDPSVLERAWREMRGDMRDRLQEHTQRLGAAGVRSVNFVEDNFPRTLLDPALPTVPILFFRGDLAIASEPGIGMCGSRAVSDLGLRAASGCGEEVSAQGMVVVSGYAKGVDTETHLAALRSGGKTVVVLAEGIDHFRIKRAFQADYDDDRTLVVSQFSPSQPWQAHAAMTRNGIIYGLGKALVVIEAGERGGTLAAGRDALKANRPVLVLNYGSETPAGNRLLLESGGYAISSREELGKVLRKYRKQAAPTDPPPYEQGQLSV